MSLIPLPPLQENKTNKQQELKKTKISKKESLSFSCSLLLNGGCWCRLNASEVFFTQSGSEGNFFLFSLPLFLISNLFFLTCLLKSSSIQCDSFTLRFTLFQIYSDSLRRFPRLPVTHLPSSHLSKLSPRSFISRQNWPYFCTFNIKLRSRSAQNHMSGSLGIHVCTKGVSVYN